MPIMPLKMKEMYELAYEKAYPDLDWKEENNYSTMGTMELSKVTNNTCYVYQMCEFSLFLTVPLCTVGRLSLD